MMTDATCSLWRSRISTLRVIHKLLSLKLSTADHQLLDGNYCADLLMDHVSDNASTSVTISRNGDLVS